MKMQGAVCAVSLAMAVGAKPGMAADAPFLMPSAESELEATRGMADPYQMQLGQLSERAILTGNDIGTAYTGDNLLAANAFGSISGIASVIQNTGNHVVIQDAVILNLSVTP